MIRAASGLVLVLAACSSNQEHLQHLDASTDARPKDVTTGEPTVDASSDITAEAVGDTTTDTAKDSPSDASDTDATLDAHPTEDAFVDAQPAFETCSGSCAVTDLALTWGGKQVPFDRAQFGFNSSVPPTLHVEAHFGGEPACPTESSPSPDRTIVFANVPIPTDTTPIEGTSVTLLDFEGSVSSNPFDKATQATLTPVAVRIEPRSDAFVGFDVNVAFGQGSLVGHVYATHCESLDL